MFSERQRDVCRLIFNLELAQFDFDTDERVTALESLTLTHKDTSLASFCVGTYKHKHGEQEPSEGKLRVFDACNAEVSGSTRLQLTPKVSVNVRGCVYALASINGMIAAAVNASVRDSMT
jgi:DNA damage-binding protein 1